MSPFVIFSLPRSRSTWLSVFLSHDGQNIGHDIGIECSSPSEFASRLRALGGTCETGAGFAWRKITQMIPDCRFVVVRRSIATVVHSLEALGYMGLVDEIRTRAQHLDEISALPQTLVIEYDDLERFFICDQIYRHCLGKPCDPAWFDKMSTINVQVDLQWQMGRLFENRERIAFLKRLATV